MVVVRCAGGVEGAVKKVGRGKLVKRDVCYWLPWSEDAYTRPHLAACYIGWKKREPAAVAEQQCTRSRKLDFTIGGGDAHALLSVSLHHLALSGW